MSLPNGRKRRRQDIVSCSFCREKKLKCDRGDPCSNCVTRHLVCSPVIVDNQDLKPGKDKSRTIPYPSPAAASDTGRTWHNHKRTAKDRGGSHVTTSGVPCHISQSFEFNGDKARGADVEQDDFISQTAIQLETTATDVGFAASCAIAGDTSSVPLPRLTLLVPLGEPLPLPILTVFDLQRALPPVAQALRLLHHYADTLNWVCPILHIPTVGKQIRTVYENMDKLDQVDHSQVAIITTILGSSAHFWTPKIGMGAHTAAELAYRMINMAQHALVNANYTEKPTMSTIQAVTLLSWFLLRDARGPTTSSSIVCLLWTWARKLSLQRLDLPAEVEQRQRRCIDHVDLEERRRFMCYLSGSDWLISAMNGPCSGTYLMHPSQLHVNLPSNVDDDALDVDGAYPRPLSTVTDASYLLLRHNLASVCREAIDVACSAGVTIDRLSYAAIMQLDRQFEEIYARIPTHLLLDEESRLLSKTIEKERPNIVWQRSMIHLGFNSKRSQLHRPFLSRGFRDPRYAYSRQICIDCARAVMKVDEDLRAATAGVSVKILQVWTVVHHLFLAGLVLALDFKINGNDVNRKKEVIQCCEALELRQEESVIAKKGAQQLRNLLSGVAFSTLVSPAAVTRNTPQEVENIGVNLETPNSSSTPLPNGQMSMFSVDEIQNPLADLASFGDLNNFDLDSFGFSDELVNSWDEIFKDIMCPPKT